MLGRLKMSIVECEAAYDDIANKIFGEKRHYWIPNSEVAFGLGTYVYDSQPLVDAVKELVAKHIPGIGPDGLLQDVNHTYDKDGCRV